MSEVFAAATVVPLRDGPGGVEVLMLRRNSRIAFGGMWVFPGGRIDDADTGGDPVEVARRAAVREAREEAGIDLAAETLIPFSHWTPPREAPKRFLTWFFLAPVRSPVDVVVDGGEIHEHAWITPGDALSKRDAGDVELAPPTWMTLHRLTRAASVDDALADAGGRVAERFFTRICFDGETMTMVWEGDAAWESGDLQAPGSRRRLVADPAGWRYEGAR